jgi:glycosyltransferase involved in cell wall biosynthesis
LSKKNILLSICIPTYNRPQLLLKNLKKHIQFHSEKVEILISDNSDTDVLDKEIKKLYGDMVSYYWNEGNVGFDLNLIRCLQRAKGKFVLYLSDEDTINEEVFGGFLSDLESKLGNYALILAHIMDIRKESNPIFYRYERSEYKKGYDALTHLFLGITYLSGMIFQKEKIILTNYQQFIGSQYMQLYLIGLGCLVGDVYCELRPLILMNKQEKPITFFSASKLKETKLNELPFNHPFSRIMQMQKRLQMINIICKNHKSAKKHLITSERGEIINQIMLSISLSTSTFLEKTSIIGYCLYILIHKFRVIILHYEFVYYILMGLLRKLSEKSSSFMEVLPLPLQQKMKK